MPSNAIARIKSAPKRVSGVAIITATLLFVAVVAVPRHASGSRQVRLGSQIFTLEVANTPAQQTKGLGDRTNLAPRHGMLFTFDQAAVQCFWMKDMHFSIDIIWLDSQERIGYIQSDVSPATYPHTFCPAVTARSVIELPAGQAQRLGLRIGQQLHF